MGLYNSISAVFFSSFCIPALILHSCSLCLALPVSENVTDRLALLEIKARITHDPFGVMTWWNETTHFCYWHGVTCGHRHQRVTRLKLGSLKLVGSIPLHIGNLSFLRVIDLQNNSFWHEIPQEIGRLRRLRELKVENNSLSGEIPSNLSHCSQLLIFSVDFNGLMGSIPKELGLLSRLRFFRICFNNFTGSLPHSLSNLSSLQVLSATSNNLSGSIPNIFGQMINLSFLSFDLNSLSGILPPSIYNLSSLIVLSMSDNKIQGTLPTNFGMAFPNIHILSISKNKFSGPVPASLSNASNLVELGLGQNQLRGKIPSLRYLNNLERLLLYSNHLGSGEIGDLTFICDLTNATRLQVVLILSNYFGGTLPHCVGNLSSSLQSFLAGQNKISGSIPKEIGNLANLEWLSLNENQLSGPIPPDVGRLLKIVVLVMSRNSISGNVPSSLGNLSLLTELHLDDNKLKGNIPPSLGECQNLVVLSLGANNFSGIIPQGILSLLNLYGLSLSHNHLIGSLPENVGNLINLQFLDISGNMLIGEIPPTLGSCVRLEYLNMDRNLFQGTIPSSLASLRGAVEITVSSNNLSGTIPEFLDSFEFLQNLNLSYNNFEGMLPIKGVFKNATATSVQGNSRLCGGMPEFHLPKCKLQRAKEEGMSLTMKVIIPLVCGIVGVALALAFLYFRRSKGKKKQDASSDTEKFPKVSYQSLVKATDGFSSTKLIGVGSFGSVYKGVVDEQSETTIAIKVLNLVHHGAYKSFIAECEALKNIRHRNLVKVISACSGCDYGGHDFKALIYEFMVNGSLEEWLHPTHAIVGVNERPRQNLTFSQRLDIVIDVAMALDYLHHHCESQIVHCDLKPSNILLDDDMVGHVGDFGLVRFVPKASANQSSSAGLKGTIGYAPPEYGMGHEVWTQGDVYSYGILVLEIFTGKRPTDNMFLGNSTLHNFVKAALPNQMIEIVDPVLVQEMSINNRSTSGGIKIEESLVSIIEIGITCSAELPGERLDISDAMRQMCRIRNKLRADI